MTAAVAALLAVAGAAASANWWSRVTGDRRLERVTKPAVLVALVMAALILEPVDGAVRWWFVAALLLSLAGDVFLLGDDRWFVAGLGAFLAAHLAYGAGFVLADPWRWWSAGVAVLVAVVLVATVGRRIVAGAAARSAGLRAPVAAYLVVISAMLVAAAGAGSVWAVAGAALFVVSDAILGWNRFVVSRPWMAPAIMVTYHLAQAGLVVSLL